MADCAGVSAGTLSGTVTNAATGEGVEGVAITLDPAVAGVDLMTDAEGAFEATLPIGAYMVTFSMSGYEDVTVSVGVIAGNDTALDIELVPAAVSVDAGDDVEAAPGDVVTLTATITVIDGSTIEGITWEQVSGTPATLSGETTESLEVTLGDADAYRDELLAHLRQRDRVNVQGIPPWPLELASVAEFEVTVTTNTGTFTDTVEVHADIPYMRTAGNRNFPVGQAVMLSGPEQDTFDWSLTSPSGSSASLDDTTIRNPYFVADAAGEYTVTESVSGQSITIYAGNYAGAITGIGADGLPDATGCTSCHNGGFAPDMFTDWRASGHAHIFSTQLEQSSHYGTGCFSCHTVGYGLDGDQNGIDDQSDYADFIAADLFHGYDDGWETVVADFPNTARMTNIQCENCHGPNSSAHMAPAGHSARVSVSADVCAQCHGEPRRHARYQQWEESGHGQFDLAESRGTSDSCAMCHSGQGFIAAVEAMEAAGDDQWPSSVDAPDAADVEPQVCAACHDAHVLGTSTGEPNDAVVRIHDNTPMMPAGFRAYGVGRGALCMTCHNSRRGDASSPSRAGARAPHGGPQADVLMGMNVFFVDPARSPHSYLTDSCTQCHMVQTDPPEELSYNLGGTNHTFEPSLEICGNCHGALDGAGIEESFEHQLAALEEYLADGAMSYLNTLSLIWIDEAVNPDTEASSVTGFAVDPSTNNITDVEILSGHGRLEFHFTFASAVSITWDDGSTTSRTDFAVQFRNLLDSDGGAQIYADDSNMTRNAWNLLLFRNDGSHGIHNPGIAAEAIATGMLMPLDP